MSTMHIVTTVMLLITIFAAGDMVIFFWRRYKVRRREVSFSRHVRLVVETLGPAPVMREPEVLVESH